MRKLRCLGRNSRRMDASLTASPFRDTIVKAPAVFFGHYWLDPGRANKRPFASNVACLDYSAGSGGPLVAYRFDGEQILNPDKFVAVNQGRFDSRR